MSRRRYDDDYYYSAYEDRTNEIRKSYDDDYDYSAYKDRTSEIRKIYDEYKEETCGRIENYGHCEDNINEICETGSKEDSEDENIKIFKHKRKEADEVTEDKKYNDNNEDILNNEIKNKEFHEEVKQEKEMYEEICEDKDASKEEINDEAIVCEEKKFDDDVEDNKIYEKNKSEGKEFGAAHELEKLDTANADDTHLLGEAGSNLATETSASDNIDQEAKQSTVETTNIEEETKEDKPHSPN
ncbi:hypothetical protein ANTQUA_LOCUS5125 [Anthophora quadrimaculata]